MTEPQAPSRWQVGIVLAIGIVAVSTAAILVRVANLATGTPTVGFSLMLAASRLGIAALLLAVIRLVVPSNHAGFDRHTPGLPYAMAAGFALALHFGTWITSLAYTSIAASTALVTTNPVWVVLVSWFLGETPQLATVIGVAIALSGGLLIGLGSESSGVAASQPLLGNALALMGAWGASAYFLLGRAAQQRRLSIQAYATIAYTTAAIVLLPLPLLFNTPYTGHAPVVYACLLIMALVPQLIGHTSLNWAVRWVSPTVVTLVILFEPVLSSLLGYLMFREAPGMAVLLGSAVLLLGVAMTVRSLSPNGNN